MVCYGICPEQTKKSANKKKNKYTLWACPKTRRKVGHELCLIKSVRIAMPKNHCRVVQHHSGELEQTEISVNARHQNHVLSIHSAQRGVKDLTRFKGLSK